VKVIPEVRRAY